METLATLANVAGVLGGFAILFGVAAVAIARRPDLVAILAAQPLRSAAPWWRQTDRTERALRRAMAHQLRLCHNGAELSTAAIVWATVQETSRRLAAGTPAVAYHSTSIRTLHAMVSTALQPERRGVLVQYLAREAWDANRTRLESCRDYLAQFLNLTVAKPPHLKDLRLPEVEPATFADFASAFSGASVLLDTTQAQGGSAAGIVVMHRPEWEGHGHIHGLARSDETVMPYAAHHAQDAPLLRMERQRVGQYDGSIPTLVSAELVEYQGLAGAWFGLTTRETCYFATEPASETRTEPGVPLRNPTPAKGLAPGWSDEHMARFARDPDHLSFRRTDDPAQGVGRPVLLNVVLALVCAGAGPSRGSLLLSRRSAGMRNAAFGLGPTSGGVVELPMRDVPRDGDRFGAIDPRHGVLRELTEELGLPADRIQVTPRAIYLSNVRNKPRAPDKLNTGQLVASILFLATTHLTLAKVRKCFAYADPVEGAFESEGLVEVQLGKDAAEFVDNLKAPVTDVPTEGALAIIDDLEQSSVLAALYASASVYGPSKTIRAVAAGFAQPWWATAWPMPVRGGAARLCRPPGSWMDTPDETELVNRLWPERGADAYREVRRLIEEDAAVAEEEARRRRPTSPSG